MKDMESRQDTSRLVDRAKAGDREAFEDIILKEGHRLEAFIHFRLGADLRKEMEVKDILQETLLRACRSIGSFEWRGGASLLNWLEAIAEHVILETASRHRRHAAIPLHFDVLAKGASPSRMLRRDERFDRLQRALDSLSPDQRQVIFLVRLEGLRVREAAMRMNRSAHAVSNLLLRATQRLEEIMGNTESFSLPRRFLRLKEDQDHA